MKQEEWQEAYESETFKELQRRRTRFIVPCAVGIGVVVSLLFAIQSWFPGIGLATPFGGYLNVDLIYSLLLMPLTLVAGFVYVKYSEKRLTPLEDELNERYGHKADVPAANAKGSEGREDVK